MLALQLTHPGPLNAGALQPVDLPIPQPAAHELRLRIRACGVCHTDLHIVEGELPPRKLPVTPGHQVVGEVEAVGEAVRRFVIGNRAGVPWLYATCGECAFCRRGEENLCDRARFTGWDEDGGYAEAMIVHEDFAVPLPVALGDVEVAPLLCAGIIGYRSLRRAEVQPGEHVGLFGFGASAHIAIQIARHWGCTVSAFSRRAEHRALAESLGAAWTGTLDQSPPWPLDRAVIFAPAGEIVPPALGQLRKGGTLAINAIHMSAIPAFDYALLYGERTVRSVANATRRDAEEFLALAAAIPVRTEVARYPLAEANAALQALKRGAVRGAAVLIP